MVYSGDFEGISSSDFIICSSSSSACSEIDFG